MKTKDRGYYDKYVREWWINTDAENKYKEYTYEHTTNNYCSADHAMKMKNEEFDSDVSQELHLFCESEYILLIGT